MRKTIVAILSLILILFAFVSCDPDAVIQQPTAPKSPAIRGTVSIPSAANLSGSDFYVRVMEGEKAVHTGKVNADGSFVVEGLDESKTYSILLTTAEPGDINDSSRDISRAATSGYGGWLSNVTASIDEKAGVGSVKVKPLGTIKGKVTRDGASDGYDTMVYIPGTSFMAMTDGEGNFSITSVPQSQNYTLRYSSSGYLSQMKTGVVLYSESDTENPVTVVPEMLLIKNAGTLRGVVTRAGSTDNSNTTILLENGETSFSGTTAQDGEFVISGITPGRYDATISASGFVTQKVDGITIEAAKTVTLDAITLVYNGGSIKGFVEFNDSNPNKAGVLVSAKSADGKFSYTTSTDASGNYVITNAYPTTYTITLSKTGYAIEVKTSVQVVAGTDTIVGQTTFSSDYGTVSGKISDTNGDPIENAIVKIGELSVFTAADGTFTKTGVAVGTYVVTVTRDGYSTQTLGQSISVESSKATDIGTVRLASIYGRISGTVGVNDGRSVEGITVTASNSSNTYSAKTGADGTYSITDMAPGTYTVTAARDGYAEARRSVAVLADKTTSVDVLSLESVTGSLSVTVGYSDSSRTSGITVSVYTGDSKVAESTTTDSLTVMFAGLMTGDYRIVAEAEGYATAVKSDVSVSSAKETSVTLSSLTNRFGTVSGKITDTNGDPIENAIVKIGELSVFTSADGSFTKTGIAVGTYSVTVSKEGYSTKTLGQSISVESSQITSIGLVELSSIYGSVTGKVSLSDSAESSGVTVTLTNAGDASVTFATVTGADGNYSFTNLTKAGQYILTICKDGFVSDTGRLVEVVLNSVTRVEDIRLSSLSSKVSGKVSLEGTEENAGISVMLKNSSVQYDATTDQDGEYLMSRVNPGEYTLIVSKSGYVTKTVEGVVVEASSTMVLDSVNLSIGSRSVTGTVQLELKTDHSGALVTATNLSDPSLVYSAISNSDGNYTLAGMRPGEYSITVSSSGYSTTTLPTVDVLEGSTMNIDSFVLPIARGTINGVVTLEGRSSSSDVTVELLQGASVYATTLTDFTGAYSFYVPQGNYSGVRCSMEDFAPKSEIISISLFAENYISMESKELKATHNTVRGIADVLTTDDDTNVIVSFDGHEEIPAVTTEAGGAFSFEHVPVGDYSLRLHRDNCSDIVLNISVVAADVIDVGTIKLTPNTGSITGKVNLENGRNLAGVLVSVDLGTETLSTTTDSSGRYEIGGVSIADVYTVSYSKDGWVSNSQLISPALDRLEIREMAEITLVDTTAPILSNVTINSGANTTTNRTVILHINGMDAGSGISKIMINEDNIFDRTCTRHDFLGDMEWTLSTGNGEKTVYVKVVDAAGNVSDTVTATVTVTDQKHEVSGVLTGEDLHWTKEQSPYLVTGNILVEENQTLIIDAGVDVQFIGAYYLHVEGILSAVGTESEKINIYGLGDGIDKWTGIKGVKDNGSTICHANITGMAQGLQGYLRVVDSTISATGTRYALGGGSSYFYGSVENSDITGRLYCSGSSLLHNTIYSSSYGTSSSYLFQTYLSGNQFTGVEVDLSYSAGENNSFSNMGVYSSYTGMLNATFENCALNLTSGGAYIRCEFDGCTFQQFAPAIVRDSNLTDCGVITITTAKTTYERLDMTGNFWGYDKTRLLDEHGLAYNHSFITDYYDDFNKTKVDVSGYVSSPHSNVGYLGDSYYPETVESETVYSIGDVGPAGGWVFYDKGYYSDGWRYLECAPSDIGRYVFGYYRATDDSDYLGTGTITGIGSGSLNTAMLVEMMGGNAYSSDNKNGKTTSEYAANKCMDYSYGGYDDWFLPSRDELNLMYENLHKSGIGSFYDYGYYWSSSEDFYHSAWPQYFGNYSQYSVNRYDYNYVRAVRAF